MDFAKKNHRANTIVGTALIAAPISAVIAIVIPNISPKPASITTVSIWYRIIRFCIMVKPCLLKRYL
ncbi:hypothetical protein TI05_05440 [Achromatium sp. WMS3]|nr:hypothetical protein TI05_05440 [Achromatium sp. WMS3]